MCFQRKSNKNHFMSFWRRHFSLVHCFGCRWSKTYGEGGHYSVWIQMSEATSTASCAHTVDKRPNNAYLRKCTMLMKFSNQWLWANTIALLRHSDSKGIYVHAQVKHLYRCVLNWVSKEKNHSTCPHVLNSNSHPSLGTRCVLIK